MPASSFKPVIQCPEAPPPRHALAPCPPSDPDHGVSSCVVMWGQASTAARAEHRRRRVHGDWQRRREFQNARAHAHSLHPSNAHSAAYDLKRSWHCTDASLRAGASTRPAAWIRCCAPSRCQSASVAGARKRALAETCSSTASIISSSAATVGCARSAVKRLDHSTSGFLVWVVFFGLGPPHSQQLGCALVADDERCQRQGCSLLGSTQQR